MDDTDVALLRRLLGELEAESFRLAQQAYGLAQSDANALVLGGRSTGIFTATSAIRCALPQLAKETV